jgi:5-methylthioadenosine/S-adenosylhomocysteine deaminase
VEGHTLFTLEGWYNTIRVLELEMDPDMLPPAVAVSCAEMIRTGTTCFADQYFWMDHVFPEVRQSGMRAVLAYGIVELGKEEARQREIGAASAFIKKLQGDTLLIPWLGPHAFFVDNSEIAMQIEISLAEKFHVGFHTHFGTGVEEERYCQEKYGNSAITQLEKMGFLKFPILAAHCITLPPVDFSTLAGKPFTVAFAPSSGMRNAAGIAPLVELRSAGVNVALGTDNVTNNNSYDMFKEMSLNGHHERGTRPGIGKGNRLAGNWQKSRPDRTRSGRDRLVAAPRAGCVHRPGVFRDRAACDRYNGEWALAVPEE